MQGAEVYMWGTKIGTVVQDEIGKAAVFSYSSEFLKSGIEVSPVMMPLSNLNYTFPALREESFHYLPGMLADSLPDKFGTKVLESYLAKQGRMKQSLSAIERLCYTGSRGMGALEYVPSSGPHIPDRSLDIDELAQLADQILSDKKQVNITADEQAVAQLLKIGTSAGGARAKALIAWNEETKNIRSGQVSAGEGYSYWLLKFGSITNNRDKDSEPDYSDYSKIEYAYSLMAKDAGIDMAECRLIKSHEGYHFMTKRFDREDSGSKIHMQSLGGIAHYDFNDAGAYSYEQAAGIMHQMGLTQKDNEKLFRRMVFNEVAKNYDDHVKNISFLMDRRGRWSLSPAYDVTFAHDINGIWTGKHQMRINGKRDNITVADMVETGRNMNITNRKANQIINEVISVVANWPKYAEYVELTEERMQYIKSFHRYKTENISVSLPVLEKSREESRKAYTIL